MRYPSPLLPCLGIQWTSATFTRVYAIAPVYNKLLGERPVSATSLLLLNDAAAGVTEFNISPPR